MPSRKFLAPRGRAGNGHGYLSQPLRPLENKLEADPPDVVELIASATRMVDEPECDSEALASYADAAEFWLTQRHHAEVLAARQLRPLLKAEDRIKDAQRRAKHAKRRDLRGEFLALEGMLARYKHADQEPKPESSLIRRLEHVEARLDGMNQQAA